MFGSGRATAPPEGDAVDAVSFPTLHSCWRRRPESNRRTRLCRPLPNHSATPPSGLHPTEPDAEPKSSFVFLLPRDRRNCSRVTEPTEPRIESMTMGLDNYFGRSYCHSQTPRKSSPSGQIRASPAVMQTGRQGSVARRCAWGRPSCGGTGLNQQRVSPPSASDTGGARSARRHITRSRAVALI